MNTKKKGRTRLPRLTVLAMSRQELQRFSDAAEKVASAALCLTTQIAALQQGIDRLDRVAAAVLDASATVLKNRRRSSKTIGDDSTKSNDGRD